MFAVALCAAGGVVGSASGAGWNEGVNGDLSNAQGAPSPVVLLLGTNSVIGTVGGTDSQDWVVITVPAGFQLTGLVHAAYASNDVQGFMGMQVGPAFVGSPFVAGSYAGFAHYGSAAVNGAFPATNTVGSNMLSLMSNPAVAPGSTGMPSVLGPGTYTFLFQQLGATTSYQFDFNLTPAPSGVALASLAFAGLARRSRR
jgi:hypothetical protein